MSSQQNKQTQAEAADRHVLYQESVQCPEAEVDFMSKTFEALKGRKALSVKEDFGGTGYLSVEWAKSDPERTAIVVDIDKPTLDWGQKNNAEAAGSDVASRVQYIEADVRDITEPKVDITNAFNFSYCIFETRDEMRKYFEIAREGIKDDGILVLDLFGGTEAMDVLEEETELEDFDATYRWEHVSFNPINNHMECAIHFDFDDGSSMENAFTYAWRLWSIPEIRELLLEAGFKNARIYWEEYVDSDEDDDELEGTGEYYETEEVENQESWMIYIVAEK
jgi:SAM-dependent methyltransferase